MLKLIRNGQVPGLIAEYEERMDGFIKEQRARKSPVVMVMGMGAQVRNENV